MAISYCSRPAFTLDDITYPNLEIFRYNGQECDANRLAEFSGGHIENVNMTEYGLECDYTTHCGQTFHLTAGDMLVRIKGTTTCHLAQCLEPWKEVYKKGELP